MEFYLLIPFILIGLLCCICIIDPAYKDIRKVLGNCNSYFKTNLEKINKIICCKKADPIYLGFGDCCLCLKYPCRYRYSPSKTCKRIFNCKELEEYERVDDDINFLL